MSGSWSSLQSSLMRDSIEFSRCDRAHMLARLRGGIGGQQGGDDVVFYLFLQKQKIGAKLCMSDGVSKVHRQRRVAWLAAISGRECQVLA